MKYLKFIILFLAIGLGAYVLWGIVGFLATLLWCGFFVGLLAIGAGVGYKLFLSGNADEDTPKLSEKKPTAISELDNADRSLAAYKKKYLPTEKE